MRSVREFEVAGGGGGSFTVTEQGDGTPVLLLHGGSNTAAAWDRVAKRLAERCRVLRFDRVTYRRRPPPAGAEGMAAEVADVRAVADAVGEELVLVGHSSGGIVALEAALASPAGLAGLVLYEPPVAVSEPLGGESLRRAAAALDNGDRDRAVTIFFRDVVQLPRPVVAAIRLMRPTWRKLREHIPAQLADTEAIDSLGVGVDRYAAVPVPVLLLGGRLLSPNHLRTRLDALADVLPDLDRQVIKRIWGHGARYSAPGGVTEIIAGFAERVMR